MIYAILTDLKKGGMPFQNDEIPSTEADIQLRVSEDATLLAFEDPSDCVLANQYTRDLGKLLWPVTEETIHPDDFPPDETFSNYRDFQVWLSRRENG